MAAAVFLPGELRDRITDLKRRAQVTNKDISEKTGISESQLSRFESGRTEKLGDEAVLKLAQYFRVSTDFLLGVTNVPDKKNYTIEELGLSAQAAKNLYTGRVDSRVVDLLLSNSDFATLSLMLADYFDETQASVLAVRNQFHENTAALMQRIARSRKELRGQATAEAKKALAQRQPLYKTELAQLEAQFSKTIRAIKQELPSHLEEKKKLTQAVFNRMLADLTKGEDAAEILSVTREEIIESIVSCLDNLENVTEEDKVALKTALLPAFTPRGTKDG